MYSKHIVNHKYYDLACLEITKILINNLSEFSFITISGIMR